MLTMVKKLCEQARARVVGLRASEVYELWEKIDLLRDEVEVKDLKLQTMPVLVEEATNLPSESAKHRKTFAEYGPNVGVMSSLQMEVSAVKKAVAELLLTVEKFCHLRIDTEKKAR